MEDPLAHARIGLVGSGEFTPAMEDIDREILATLPRHPRVVILPTAAGGEDPDDWAFRGVEHFTRLGARSAAVMVLNWSHAEDPEHAAQVERADLQGMAVVPHYDRWIEADGLAAEIEAYCTVFGIPEDSAILLDERHGRALGRAASCVRGRGGTTWVGPGERFELAPT